MSAVSEVSVSRIPMRGVSTPAVNPLILTLIFNSSTQQHTAEHLHQHNEQALILVWVQPLALLDPRQGMSDLSKGNKNNYGLVAYKI